MSERMDQKARWNGPGAKAWITNRDLLDAMFQPFRAILAEAVRPGEAVLDVGCGTGGTTLAVASAVGPAGAVTGVDISEPMIAVARERAAAEGSPARFLAADAQDHAFDAGAYDRLVSRFGVMFFADPVRAFANLRRACRPGGAMLFVAWRGRDENPFMTAADRAAAPLLLQPPEPRAATGQFAFADADYVTGILADAGWRDAAIERLDVTCSFPAAELPRYAEHMGPLAPTLGALDPGAREPIVKAILDGYAPFVSGDVVSYTAACWAIRGRA